MFSPEYSSFLIDSIANEDKWSSVEEVSEILQNRAYTINRILDRIKNISYKQHTIPACYGKKFFIFDHIQKYKVCKMWSIISKDMKNEIITLSEWGFCTLAANALAALSSIAVEAEVMVVCVWCKGRDGGREGDYIKRKHPMIFIFFIDFNVHEQNWFVFLIMFITPIEPRGHHKDFLKRSKNFVARWSLQIYNAMKNFKILFDFVGPDDVVLSPEKRIFLVYFNFN